MSEIHFKGVDGMLSCFESECSAVWALGMNGYEVKIIKSLCEDLSTIFHELNEISICEAGNLEGDDVLMAHLMLGEK